MQGWLAPEGPEQAQTYWRRRAVVIGIVVLVVALLGVAVWAATRPAPDAQRTQETTPVGVPPTPTTTPTPSTTSSATSSPSTSAAPSASDSPSASASPSATPTEPPAPVACAPKDLRLAVSGAPRVKSGEDEVLTLSVTNGGKAACIASVTKADYELRIMSGSDLIWSTAHCAGWLAEATPTLQPEQAHEWQLTWNTRRSKPECELTGDYLKPGTYVAQPFYQGEAGARLVVQLQG